ncbi:MAG: peptidoglycan recognition family protein [Anaerovoracaceae bacterium]
MPRSRTKSKKRRPIKNKKGRQERWMLIIMAVIVCLGVFTGWKLFFAGVDAKQIRVPNWIQQDLITTDGHSRTGREAKKIKDIVIHYVANPGSSAKANRDYFESGQSNVSAHFVVGLEGEIIQCIPLNEQSSASNNRNVDTISIEVCHPDSSGKFNKVTYQALVQLSAWLCNEFKLSSKDLIRHYDITGKLCPKYFVDYPDQWEKFKKDVKKAK